MEDVKAGKSEAAAAGEARLTRRQQSGIRPSASSKMRRMSTRWIWTSASIPAASLTCMPCVGRSCLIPPPPSLSLLQALCSQLLDPLLGCRMAKVQRRRLHGPHPCWRIPCQPQEEAVPNPIPRRGRFRQKASPPGRTVPTTGMYLKDCKKRAIGLHWVWAWGLAFPRLLSQCSHSSSPEDVEERPPDHRRV